MNIVAIAYEHLIDRFIRWAQTEDNIRAAVVIGSRARVDHPADEWSDLDLIILADDPEPYWATTDRIRVSEPGTRFLVSYRLDGEKVAAGRAVDRQILLR